MEDGEYICWELGTLFQRHRLGGGESEDGYFYWTLHFTHSLKDADQATCDAIVVGHKCIQDSVLRNRCSLIETLRELKVKYQHARLLVNRLSCTCASWRRVPPVIFEAPGILVGKLSHSVSACPKIHTGYLGTSCTIYRCRRVNTRTTLCQLQVVQDGIRSDENSCWCRTLA